MVLNQWSLLKMALIQRAPSKWAKGHILWNARSFQGICPRIVRALPTSDFCEKWTPPVQDHAQGAMPTAEKSGLLDNALNFSALRAPKCMSP